MKRILISNVNVFNADSRYSSIISGVPGAWIEDVTFSNIHIYHQGGYTAEDGKRIPPENEKDLSGTMDVRHYSGKRFLYPSCTGSDAG